MLKISKNSKKWIEDWHSAPLKSAINKAISI